MKKYIFSQHSTEQIQKRGTSREEVIDSIKLGKKIPAKKGRESFQKDFIFRQY